ncbi:MAG: hypothetical protein BJ554DRAFT_7474 [Olpidium bornovanus]|uniref:Uncharacterized protein n=1 Tax=Olpidium bornovanus TaxID=278681 RepID=A0A8H8A209_9FUNG|nr:MAG: hypothetical protein BJ554DRAFT_7474 [Olpidium bornovanus]
MAPYVKVLSTDGKFHGPISAAVTLEQVARWLRLPGTISLRSLVLREPGEDPEVIEDPDFLVPPGVYEVVRGDCSDDPGVGRGRKKKTKAEEVRLQARIRREVSQFERKSAQPTRPHEEAGGGGGEEATRRAAVVSAETPNLGEREVRRKLEDALRAVYQQVALKTEAALSGSSAGPDDLTPLLREVEYCFLDLVDLIEEAACIAGPGSRPLVEHITSESVRRTLKFLYIKLVEIHRMLETASCTVLDEGSKDPSGKKGTMMLIATMTHFCFVSHVQPIEDAAYPIKSNNRTARLRCKQRIDPGTACPIPGASIRSTTRNSHPLKVSILPAS